MDFKQTISMLWNLPVQVSDAPYRPLARNPRLLPTRRLGQIFNIAIPDTHFSNDRKIWPFTTASLSDFKHEVQRQTADPKEQSYILAAERAFRRHDLHNDTFGWSQDPPLQFVWQKKDRENVRAEVWGDLKDAFLDFALKTNAIGVMVLVQPGTRSVSTPIYDEYGIRQEAFGSLQVDSFATPTVERDAEMWRAFQTIEHAVKATMGIPHAARHNDRVSSHIASKAQTTPQPPSSSSVTLNSSASSLPSASPHVHINPSPSTPSRNSRTVLGQNRTPVQVQTPGRRSQPSSTWDHDTPAARRGFMVADQDGRNGDDFFDGRTLGALERAGYTADAARLLIDHVEQEDWLDIMIGAGVQEQQAVILVHILSRLTGGA